MTSSSDLTFMVYPRPNEDAPKKNDTVLEMSLQVDPLFSIKSKHDSPGDRESFFANLAFVVRFAFGRY